MSMGMSMSASEAVTDSCRGAACTRILMSSVPIALALGSISMGLAAAAFMNFGGHHTLVECLPIAKALAEQRERLKLSVEVEHEVFYADVLHLVTAHAGGEAERRTRHFHELYVRAWTEERAEMLAARVEELEAQVGGEGSGAAREREFRPVCTVSLW